jgi:tryptophan synthase alpha chain
MNRIDARFSLLKKENKAAFVAYITAGDPSVDLSVDLVLALDRAGADVVELGVPFSDPLADGVVNQMAAQRALEAGMQVEDVFTIVERVRERSEVPLVLFTYYNPVHRYGDTRFIQRAEKAGVDGILLLDLPPEESEAVDFGEVRRIQLIAPTTPEERMKRLGELASGFIYYVSREGVTGMQSTLAAGLQERVEGVRRYGRCPVCVGFGISNAAQAAEVGRVADGVVVGSALVNFIAGCKERDVLATGLESFARQFAEATHNARI